MVKNIIPIPYKTQLADKFGFMSRPWEKFMLEIYRRLLAMENGLDQGPNL